MANASFLVSPVHIVAIPKEVSDQNRMNRKQEKTVILIDHQIDHTKELEIKIKKTNEQKAEEKI